MKRADLVAYLDEYLHIGEINDYGPQGLQVEGREEVRKIVGMVDAQLPCVEVALSSGGRPAVSTSRYLLGRAEADSRAHMDNSSRAYAGG